MVLARYPYKVQVLPVKVQTSMYIKTNQHNQKKIRIKTVVTTLYDTLDNISFLPTHFLIFFILFKGVYLRMLD